MNLIWLPQATLEFNEALDWYESQAPVLRERLLAEASRAIDLIERFPRAWHPASKRVRFKRLDRFPYSFVYSPEDNGTSTIVAFAHQHRKPGYWQPRLIDPD